jgi:hypothetical protein
MPEKSMTLRETLPYPTAAVPQSATGHKPYAGHRETFE